MNYNQKLLQQKLHEGYFAMFHRITRIFQTLTALFNKFIGTVCQEEKKRNKGETKLTREFTKISFRGWTLQRALEPGTMDIVTGVIRFWYSSKVKLPDRDKIASLFSLARYPTRWQFNKSFMQRYEQSATGRKSRNVIESEFYDSSLIRLCYSMEC